MKDLSDKIKQKYSKIDVLLNNAGGANKTKQITTEGLEKTFATNQMNYFVLSTELLEIISESNDGRIVNGTITTDGSFLLGLHIVFLN